MHVPDALADGSSPLTRGKLRLWGHAKEHRRLIPAHAGKTRRWRPATRPTRAHPRSRGENQGYYQVVTDDDGSSPLTRGKHDVIDRTADRVRLIPAHAGKTSKRSAATSPASAHPRSRGENRRTSGSSACRSGSSPLTRGKPAPDSVKQLLRRLIPAHAGKTVGGALRFVVPGAHPRSRGENTARVNTPRNSLGSSPLTRGKLDHIGEHGRDTRLIPAHAGKTLPDLRFYRADRSDLGKP